jgi:hypothetical protein
MVKVKVCNPDTEDELEESIQNVVPSLSLIMNSVLVGGDACVLAEGKHLYQVY